LSVNKSEISSVTWRLYQLALEYALKFCSKKCYDLLVECQEYILERVTREGLKKLSAFEGRSKESTFVYTVIMNLVKDYLKTKKSTVSYDETYHEVQVTPNSNILNELEQDEAIEALKTLDSQSQLIMKLRYFDEYPVNEIADLFHKTPKQISKKIENIKKKLRGVLDV